MSVRNPRRPPATFAVAVIALALAGCAAPRAQTPADAAVRCDAPGAGANVYVEVGYDATGMPSATPEECTVDRGARIEWRGPDGRTLPFLIRFKRDNPVPGARGGELPSQSSGRRQAAWGVLGRMPGRYPYAIRAGLKERDPAIIIR